METTTHKTKDFLIDNAYTKIKSCYEKGVKNRKFILHLIHSFLPIDKLDFCVGSDYQCCITKKIGVPVDEAANVRHGIPFFRDGKMFDTKIKPYLEKYEIEKGEHEVFDRRMYKSESSDQYLSTPALLALKKFCDDRLHTLDTDITIAVRSKAFALTGKMSYKEANIFVRKHLGQNLSKAHLKIYNELKKKF